MYTGFWWAILRDRDHFEDPGVDGRIILRFHLAQDCYRWRAFVNAVMKLRVP